MFKVLITGATGFIGRALSLRLMREGYEVFTLSSTDGDITERATWASLPGTSVVIHLAGKSSVPESWNAHHSPEFFRINVVGTEQAITYCREHGARLVLASTYVYGVPTKLPISETDPTRPNNPYALSKRLAESLCEFASTYHGINTTVLRLFNVYGPGQRSDFLIPWIIEQLHGGQEIRVKETASKRDYVYIDDVLNAFVKACARKNLGHEVFNVASGTAYSVADVIALAQKIAGTNLPVIAENQFRPHDIKEVLGDISAAKQEFDWQPTYALEEGIKTMLGNSR